MRQQRISIKELPTKYRLILLAAILLVAVSFILSALKAEQPKVPIDNPGEPVESSSSSIELAMVGDMLPHDTITNAAKSSEDYNYLQLISGGLTESFKKADIRFCNQEAVSTTGLAVDGYPAFNAPVAFPRDINKFGCDLISTANNHAADKGSEGISGTLEAWDGIKPLAVSGSYRTPAESETLRVVEKNGIKIGFTAFNEVNNISPPSGDVGVSMLSDTVSLEQQITSLKREADLVVVSVHWGKEDSHEPTESQKKYAKKISDLGVDIIIGTGPHVWQPYQVLDRADGGKTHLWYSIGNGLNSQTEQDQLFSGVALINISKGSTGAVEINNPRVLPTYMHYEWGGGVGMSQSQLLARKNIEWGLLAGSQQKLDKRNDFKTTEQEQKENLRNYINNPLVELLEGY